MPFCRGVEQGCQLCCRTLKGDVTALPAITRSVQMHRVFLPGTKVTAVTCGCHLQWQGDHWLLTVTLTLERQVLSFCQSVRFAWD